MEQRNRLAELRDDARGTALVEFAFAFPFLLMLYLGAYVFSDASACDRKVAITARALTDLAARSTVLTEADATAILNAGAQVLSPYDAANAAMVLSELRVTSSTQATVVWSRTRGGAALTANSSVTIPANTAATGTYLLQGNVTYTYTPVAWVAPIAPITLRASILMLPRKSDQVPIS